MKNIFLSKYTILASIIIFVISGCAIFGGPSSTKTIPVDLIISATENLNPDIENRASPIVMRLYQLKQIDTFNNSDFFALYENDQTLLTKDLNYREEFEIKPNQSSNKIIQISIDSKFIAVLAAYRNLDGAQWKAYIEINPLDLQSFKIDLEKAAIRIFIHE